jgi:class 3 adenylate cyclase
MAQRTSRSVPRTFLFTDLRDYTAFIERAGDTAASELLRLYRALVRRAVSREEGAEIKTEGDSFYVVFDSSVSAVRCALAIQGAAARRPHEGLSIGIGVHTGEATPFDEQYVGSAVNIAARLAARRETAGEGRMSGGRRCRIIPPSTPH